MAYFKLCGILNKINGLIIGKFINKREKVNQNEVIKIYLNFLRITNFQYFVDIGHVENQITLPIGGRIKIDSVKKITLKSFSWSQILK